MDLLPKDVVIMISRIADAKGACSLKAASKRYNLYITTIDLKAHYITLAELGFTKDVETYNYAIRHTEFDILALHHANDEEVVRFALLQIPSLFSSLAGEVLDKFIDQLNLISLVMCHIETLKALRSLGLFRYTDKIAECLHTLNAPAVEFIYKSFLYNIDLKGLDVIKSAINVGNISGTSEFIKCAIDMGFTESQIQKKVEHAARKKYLALAYTDKNDGAKLVNYKIPLCRANIYKYTVHTVLNPLTTFMEDNEVNDSFDNVKDPYDMLDIIYTMTLTDTYLYNGSLCTRLLDDNMTRLYWQCLKDLNMPSKLTSGVAFMGHSYKKYNIKFDVYAPIM